MAAREIDWRYAMGRRWVRPLSTAVCRPGSGSGWSGGRGACGLRPTAGLVPWAGPGRCEREAAHGLHACDRCGAGSEPAGESVRAALEVAAPAWVAAMVDVPELALRYGERVNARRLPSSPVKRDPLATVFGQDAMAVLRAVWAPTAPPVVRTLEPVALLRRIVVQTCMVTTDPRGREVARKREAESNGVPPGHPYARSAAGRPADGDGGLAGAHVAVGQAVQGPAVRAGRAVGGQGRPRARTASQRTERGGVGRGEPAWHRPRSRSAWSGTTGVRPASTAGSGWARTGCRRRGWGRPVRGCGWSHRCVDVGPVGGPVS